MKIVTFTTLYPNAIQFRHGIFVEQRLLHLLAATPIQSIVIAPVPWFPWRSARFGRYGMFARIPRVETRQDVTVLHPRYPVIPKVGMTLAPLLMAVALKRQLRRLIEQGYDFDLIDAHYFYPDGVTAAILGKIFSKPVVITARGVDINLIPQYVLPRRMIIWAARRAAQLITVSKALKSGLLELGLADGKVTVLRNGVDLELFQPIDRQKQRARIGLSRRTLLSVGHLIPRKGHDLIIKALVKLPDTWLLIVGEGPEERTLKALAAQLGLTQRVKFVAPMPHDQLKLYYGSADILVLASSSEGWANVLLESMACGTPVVATAVSGAPELVTAPEAGMLIQERTPEGIAGAINHLFSHYPERADTRRFAEKFSWDDTTQGQLALFRRIVGEKANE